MSGGCPNLYKRARLSTGMSQERAAEVLGLSPESLKQYEGGRRVPPDEVVARMVEVYRLPWLALEHSQATDRLGVLPRVEEQPLVNSSVALENRLRDLTGQLGDLMRIAEDNRIDQDERPEFDAIAAELWDTLAAIYQVIFAAANGGIKRERPDGGTSKRSVQGLHREQLQNDYSIYPQRGASPNFRRRGGVSL